MFEMISNKCHFLSQSFWVLAQTDAAPAAGVQWYQTGFAMFGALILLLFLSAFLGRVLAGSLRMPEYSGKLSVIFGCILISVLLISSKWPPKFGIDLRGGMNLIGELNLEDLDGGKSDYGVATTTTAKDIIPNLVRRVDPSGTREIMIRPLGTDKIEVTIPTDSEQVADEIWERLAKTGLLQFRILVDSAHSNDPDQSEVVKRATAMSAQGDNISVIRNDDGNVIGRWIRLARADSDGEVAEGEVLAVKFVPQGTQFIRDSASGKLVEMQSIPVGNDETVAGMRFAQWWRENQPGSPQILIMVPPEDMNVEGKHLSGITTGIDERGRPSVNFDLTDDGSLRMGEFTLTHEPNTEGRYFMGIVLDGQLHSAPTIEEAIYGRGRITGSFSEREVNDLVINLRSGKLDVALNENPISKQFIESSLGQELKDKGIYAVGLSFVIVLVFMLFYYRFSGVVATFALLMNLLLILACIMAIQQPLTLTGLAGLVLTVGMSVDANVLIFERIREELDRGAALRMAIRNGFDKATVTIVDANVTTLITAIVLYVIGTEQIKGFAVTLILGILMSMFTAIYCSRAIFAIAERKRLLKKLTMMRILGKTEINILGARLIAAAVSVILIGIGVAAMFTLGPKILNHDLRGGQTVRMVMNESWKGTTEDIRSKLATDDTKVKGEDVDFTVSKLVYEDEFKDRVFKVDANIQSYDGKGKADYEQLDEILSRVFAGELSLHHVEVISVNEEGDQTTTDDTENQSGSTKPEDNPKLSYEHPPWWNHAQINATIFQNLQSIATATLLNAGLLQDPIPPAQAPPTTTPAAAGDLPAAGATQEPAEGPSIVTTVSDLQFSHSIAGKALKTLLSQAAEDEGYEITEDQIAVKAKDSNPADNQNKVMSKDWEITIKSNNRKQIDTMFQNWSGQFNTAPYFPTISAVGGQIARDTQLQALAAIIASLIGIIAYVWIRFQNVAFGLAAVVALLHDVLIVLGFIAISHYVSGGLGILGVENFKISLPVVAALLTIIGYSLNDTIVVFDRIREVRGKRQEITSDIVNTSICQTLSRTILTSLTTFIVVFILYCFGGDAIHGFAFALLIGVVAGTYSSVFVASPVLLWLMNRVGLNPGLPETETTAN
ncbi:MAG: protein translocase subunit SecD [Mariniblastus sp.]|nr:protein translocase subunit SecD [Mariniblastus sp.]